MPIDRLPPSEPNAPAALLTPPGRGAVATIRCAGDGRRIDAARLFHAANGKLLAEQTVGRILFGWWNTHPPEDVVVCRTDEATVEIHCHGGDAAARRILDDLAATGFTVQTWQAELAARGGRFAAECAELLARTTTLRTAEIALEQQTAWPQAVGSLQTALRSGQHDDLRNVVAAIDRLLARAEFGRRLTQPANVVLAGRPNVGKSSLTNALLGYARSIVFDQPGTTRDVVTAETALDGWPVRFSDTAGLRSAAEPLEAAGIDRARQHLSAADCRLLLLDCSRPPHADDEQLLADWPDSIIVAHKCDLPNQWHDQTPPAALHVSSITGEGLEELMQNIVARLIPEPPSPAAPIPFTPRQLDRLQQARKAIQEQTPHIAVTHLAEITNEPSLPTGLAPMEK